jgi:cell division protein FtsB
MKIRHLAIALILVFIYATFAHAQQSPTAIQRCGNQVGQLAAENDTLGEQLDAAKAQIADLQKQLDAAKADAVKK